MNDVGTNALEGARELLRQRDELKKKLAEELRAAEARVAEIRAVLAELGAPPQLVLASSANVTPAEAPRLGLGVNPKRATIPELIAAFVRQHPDGVEVGAIVKAVLATKPSVTPQTIYPAVYRMAEDGRLRLEKDRYFPTEPKK